MRRDAVGVESHSMYEVVLASHSLLSSRSLDEQHIYVRCESWHPGSSVAAHAACKHHGCGSGSQIARFLARQSLEKSNVWDDEVKIAHA